MEIKVLWEGQIPLENVLWRKQSYEFRLSEKLDTERVAHWNQHVTNYPDDYDGKLIFLRNFEFNKNKLILNVGVVRFSTMMFILARKSMLNDGLGTLGSGGVILSPCKRYILVGEKSKSRHYCPGLLTIPGGVLELKDLNDKSKALMREIDEEVPLPLLPKVTILALVRERNWLSAHFLLLCKINPSDFDPQQTVHAGKNEFEDNLHWMAIDRLLELPKEALYDPLIYLQSKLVKDRYFLAEL